uniref:Uncharacterized protein n=1 Tax=Sphaerodactylus townsendi TaxID=933632 RepID=A0ACB8G1Q9_9SAUR
MPPQLLDWAAEGFGRRQTVRAGEPSGGAPLDAPAGSGPPAVLSPHAASPGSEGEAVTGDGRTGSAPGDAGSDAPQRFGAAAEGFAGRQLSCEGASRDFRGSAHTTAPGGMRSSRARPGMTGQAWRSGGRQSLQGEGPFMSVGGKRGDKRRRTAAAGRVVGQEAEGRDAIWHNSYLIEERKIEQGNVDEAFYTVDQIIEGESHTGGQKHFYLETNSTVVIPRKEDNELIVYVSTQDTSNVQQLVASTLGIQSNRINCQMTRAGGAFGGKMTKPSFFAAAAAVATHKTGCPVRFVMERDDDMFITGGRSPFLGKYKVGFMNDGKIKAVDLEYYVDGGCTKDMSDMVIEYVVLKSFNAYDIPNFRCRGRACKTNLPSNTAFRGFGFPQTGFAAEVWVEAVADELGLPHVTVREMNMYKTATTTPFKQEIDPQNLIVCWKECLKRSDYYNKSRAIEEFNKTSYWKKKGIAIIPMMFSNGGTKTFYHQAASLVNIYVDGSVLVHCGGSELGQGLYTRVLQAKTAFSESINLSAAGYFPGYHSNIDWKTGKGHPFPYFVFGAACSEVEIDCLTGDHKNLQTDIVIDACYSINPAINVGQIEGGFMQGLGYYTSEEVKFSPEGQQYTLGPDMYKIPAVCDVPEQLRIYMLPNTRNPIAIYSSKGLGEAGVFLASSVFFAIKDAVAAARKQRGLNGVFTLDSPLNIARIRMACTDHFTEMIPKDVPGTYKPWAIDGT